MSDHTSFAQPIQFDQLSVATPEQVDLSFPLAGLGSRFLAAASDTVLITAAYLVVLLLSRFVTTPDQAVDALARQSSHAQNWWTAAIIFVNFLLLWGYFALFEAFWNGQTPGKRLIKIRVIKDSGRSITFFEALARNLLRFVDYLPALYFVGVIAILSNRAHKRLGDLVAGTLVVHESIADQPLLTHVSRSLTSGVFATPTPDPAHSRIARLAALPELAQLLPRDAVARLGPADLHLIESFFNRALDLTVEKRAELARRVAATLCIRLGITLPEDLDPERLLELVAHQMRSH